MQIMTKSVKQKIFELKHNLRTLPSKCREKVEWGIAFILPKQIAYCATIRTWAHATTGEYSNTHAPSITVAEVLNRWD